MFQPVRIGLIVAVLLGLGVFAWGIGLGPTANAPSARTVPGLTDSVTLHRQPPSPPTIQAQAPTDAVTALGYVHGRRRAWTIALWRQTALGKLGHWFGNEVTVLDRHARLLGLARHARMTYERLPAAHRARLNAYARGVNAALHTPAVREADPFVLLDVTPQSWAPWHTLLVERLLAWTATPPLTVPDAAPPAVAQFKNRDHQFRRWLHLHGWSRSIAWAAHPDSTRPALFQRHVMGNAATPLIQEVIWERPDASSMTWATLPGGLLFPTGTSGRRAWASLLHSRAQLVRAPLDSGTVRYWYERLAPQNSDESLLRVERLDDALLLGTSAPADSLSPRDASATARRDSASASAWTVRWPGFSTGSDLAAWLHRAGLVRSPGASSTFSLFAADGLRVSAAGNTTVLGSPPVRTSPHSDLTAVGRSPWTRFQAEGVAQAMATADSVHVANWSVRDSSTWAAALAPHLQHALPAFPSQDNVAGDAVTYLQNWNYDYEPMSIGAVLFDAWMRAYRAELGRVPTPRDTAAYFARYRGRRAFQQALDTLITTLGPDTRRWRWERLVSNRLSYPAWSADSLLPPDLRDLSTSRYAPIERTPRGHPSTPSGGPSLIDPSPVGPAPDTWAGWMQPGDPMTVRRHRFDPEEAFARWRLKTDRPAPQPLRPSQSLETVLVPAN